MATPIKPNSRLGTYVLKTFKDESFRAYVPPPLPPDPPLALQPLLPLLEQANQALGRLDGLASILPDPSLFIYLYVRKEAVLSSQIEGTQSSFSDLKVPVSWVYGHTRKRSIDPLPGYRLGKYWRFREDEVLAWVQPQGRDREAA